MRALASTLLAVALALAGYGVSIVPGATLMEEFQVARLCFIGAATAVIGAYFLWFADNRRKPAAGFGAPIAVGCSAALVLVISVSWALSWVNLREKTVLALLPNAPAAVPPAREPTPEVSHEQYVKLSEIASLFSKKEEALVNEFDIEDMVNVNIARITQRVFPGLELEQYKKVINVDRSWPLMFYQKYLDMRRLEGGGIMAAPRGIEAIMVSPIFSSARERVESFEASYLIPSDAKSGISSFKRTLDDNVLLLFDVLNEKLMDNPKNFIENFDPNSANYGNISFAYRRRFKPLKPDAEKVIAAIQSSLRTK